IKVASIFGFAMLGVTADGSVFAQTGELPTANQAGRIEAESYVSASSSVYPRGEFCSACSGQGNIGYFWGNSWFELEVDSPEMTNYTVSLQAASPLGTSIALQAVHGKKVKTLATFSVPKTGAWGNYLRTGSKTISLPAGVQTLRVKNLGEGANIDYVNFVAADASAVNSRQPKPNAGPDINPLKGFSSGWWRADDDFASVGFQYIEWRHLEPKDDEFDFDYIDREILNRAGTQGRHLILQFVVDWDDWNLAEPVPDGEQGSYYRGPQWLKELMGEGFEHGPERVIHNNRDRITRATNYDNPIFIAELQEAIAALLNHYKEDERGFVVQVGALGFWGEWHTYPKPEWNPTVGTQRDVLTTYMEKLPTGLFTQVRFPDDPLNLEFAQRGMGYTNGSVVPTPHGYEFVDAIDHAPGELWKNGPVGGEWPPGIDDVTMWENFFQKDIGLDYVKRGRFSTILAPEIDSSSPWTDDIVGRLGDDFDPSQHFMTMHRAMGYNFQVNDVKHILSDDESGRLLVEVDMANTGIAPFYQDWTVQMAVLEKATGDIVDVATVDTDLRNLREGKSTKLSAAFASKLDPEGDYQIGLRIMQPGADTLKKDKWRLDARNVYVVLANDIEVIEGTWGANNVLTGGWNILDTVQPQPAGPTFFVPTWLWNTIQPLFMDMSSQFMDRLRF
ncbi:MAG: carbohydrate-binding protein, partial [Planctomycetaceae bacterium]